MQIFRDLEDVSLKTPTALTFGVYDGLHCGHQSIIRKLVERARIAGLTSTVLTFDPHPRAVLHPETAPPMLQSFDQKMRTMRALGVEQVVVLRFTRELASVSAQDFLDKIIFGRLDAQEVYLGRGFAFGHNREGHFDLLKETADRLGRIAEAVPEVTLNDKRISSTTIRKLVAAGRVNLARKMLSRPYEIEGLVIEGRKLGKAKLNYPTANVNSAGFVQPGIGVYVTYTRIGAAWRQSVTNVGRRPTFGGESEVSIETHIFDFDADLYGQSISVGFLHRLRGEVKFESIDALRNQIGRDARRAREYFSRGSTTESLNPFLKP